MAVPGAEQFGFLVEWHDPQADLLRQYTLTFYQMQSGDNEVAMFDFKNKRTFLRRTPVAGVQLNDFHIGSTVTIFSRLLTVKDFLDSRTRETLGANREELTLRLSPDGFRSTGEFITSLEESELAIKRLRLVDDSGPTLVAVVVGSEARSKIEKMQQKAAWGAAVSVVQGTDQEEYFVNFERFPSPAAYDNCTLCIIRPSAVRASSTGNIVQRLTKEGFEISAMKMLHLSRSEGQELLEVYKGVLPYFSELVSEMISAPCVAMELRAPDAVEALRRLCGPHDVELAKHIRPQSLRAQFGTSNAKNAVHATDLATDAEIEARYMFDILRRA